MLGSEHNDEFYMEGGAVRTRTNRSGGVQGGISNGEAVYNAAITLQHVLHYVLRCRRARFVGHCSATVWWAAANCSDRLALHY